MDMGERAVEAYIRASQGGVRKKLLEVRRAIREIAPNAKERISYGMPYFDY